MTSEAQTFDLAIAPVGWDPEVWARLSDQVRTQVLDAILFVYVVTCNPDEEHEQ